MLSHFPHIVRRNACDLEAGPRAALGRDEESTRTCGELLIGLLRNENLDAAARNRRPYVVPQRTAEANLIGLAVNGKNSGREQRQKSNRCSAVEC